MRELLKRYLSVEARNRIRARLPEIVFRQQSYSQCGEDLLVTFLLELIHGGRPKSYIDVGANHPYHLSNTALLYSKGGSGILVEPDPAFARLLVRKRPRDRVLACGVHYSGEMQADFYVFDSPTLNTFSAQEKDRYVAMGHLLVDTIVVRLIDINAVLKMLGNVDFVNLDIEGLDEEILRKIDWHTHRPTCLCVETISYETKGEPRKLASILNYMAEQDYMLYADTFINSIFVDRYQWVGRYSANRTGQ
jgi:FkbM family methyltransferase